MKHIHYIYIGALAFLIACSSEESITTDSNEKAKEPIKLSAGIVDGSSKATTRTEPTTYQALTTSTQLALQVSGTWIGHDPVSVVKTTTATIGTASETNKPVNFTPAETLYWDDYGSADPANMVGEGNGRGKGLTIYGAAIDSKTTAAAVSNWNALSWTLSADQTASGETPAEKDLLISNNIQATPNGDGTYLFVDRNTAGRLLKFKHAMSKITVILTAGEGFVDKTSDNDSYVDFQNDPVVLLTSNTSTEWACTKGNVNITSGEVTLTGTSSSGDPAVITMWQASSTGHVVTKEALVMPGSQFASDNAIIARINADGNIYYVTAEKIRTAINSSTHGTDDAYSTEAGKNYIIKVTVDKTGISNVSATVTNWTNVEAVAVAPKINVTGDLGSEGTALEDGNYSFYRSAYVNATSINTGYGIENETTHFFAGESIITKSGSTWTMSTPLYWPDHNTHYQFRCVWPQTTTENDASKPRVKTSGDYQVIEIKNVQYPNTPGYPSDLMIARPEVANQDANCGNNESTHTKCNLYTQGICAREGNIKLTFKYMMSKVEVNLSTSGESDPNKVILTNAKVELINIKNTGEVKLGDMGVIPTGDTGNYELHPVSESPNSRLDAIVPQTFSSTKFKITIYKNGVIGDGIDDIYYADISDFTPEGWISGNHYVYNLTVTKTEVQVSATLTDWSTVEANHSIWF